MATEVDRPGLPRPAYRSDGEYVPTRLSRIGPPSRAGLLVQFPCAMTADYFPFPRDFLGRVATRLVNIVEGINRVVYDVPPSRPAQSSGRRAGRPGSVQGAGGIAPSLAEHEQHYEMLPLVGRHRALGHRRLN